MPLILESDRVPTRWLEGKTARKVVSIDKRERHSDFLRLALINNMPDPALEDTEFQFFELLDAASDDLPVLLKLYSLAGVPRSDHGMRHLNSFYFDVADLLNSECDAVIMTGTEPRQPNLRQETYWGALTNLLDWAERNSTSTILSCLAAHAGVLHSDGIERQRLSDKQFGVFEFDRCGEHVLTERMGRTVRFPHSRWNEVRADALQSCGYTVLTQSSDSGVDCFVKKKKKSLFIHFQGHPEYGEYTLLKEYRRDIKRFLRGERDTYPTAPFGYFDAQATQCLAGFQEKAMSSRSEDSIRDFPEAEIVKQLQNTWKHSAVNVYRNWLRFLYDNRQKSTYYSAPRLRRAGAALPFGD